MKLLFVFLLSFIVLHASAQDSWMVCFDRKTVLTASTENTEKNVVRITTSDLQKKKNLIICYKESTPQKNWERIIIAYDDKDRELKKQTGTKFMLSAAELKTLLQQSKTIMFYTLYLPTDPKLKAQVRVRRVHLCTLIFFQAASSI